MVYFPKLSEWLWRIDGLFLVCLSSNLLIGSLPLGARSDAGTLNRRCFSSGFYHLRLPFDTRTIPSFILYRVPSVFLFASFLRRFFGAYLIHGELTSLKTQLPPDYLELEKRVDALKGVHQKMLAVTYVIPSALPSRSFIDSSPGHSMVMR